MTINQSNLPTITEFRFENFPDADKWFAQFLNSLNLFVIPVSQMIAGNISYQNLSAPRFFTKVITTPAAGALTFNFISPIRIVPTAILIGNIHVNGNPSIHPSSSTCVYWHYSQGSIYIDDIPNLTASTTYVVTLAVF
jgi:hypothetical protein